MMKRTLFMMVFCFVVFVTCKANNHTTTGSIPGGGTITVSYNRDKGDITIFAQTDMAIEFIYELKITIKCTQIRKLSASEIGRGKRNTIAPRSPWERTPYEVFTTYNNIPVNRPITTTYGVTADKIPLDTENQYYQDFSIQINSVRAKESTRTVVERPNKTTRTPSVSTTNSANKGSSSNSSNSSSNNSSSSSNNNSANSSTSNSNSDSKSETKTETKSETKTDNKRDSVTNNNYGYPHRHHPPRHDRPQQENLGGYTTRKVSNSSNENYAYITNPDATADFYGQVYIYVELTSPAAERISVLVQVREGNTIVKNGNAIINKGNRKASLLFSDLKKEQTYSAIIVQANADKQ